MSRQIDRVTEASFLPKVWLFLSCLVLAAGTVAFVVGVLIRTHHNSTISRPAEQEPAVVIFHGAP